MQNRIIATFSFALLVLLVLLFCLIQLSLHENESLIGLDVECEYPFDETLTFFSGKIEGISYGQECKWRQNEGGSPGVLESYDCKPELWKVKGKIVIADYCRLLTGSVDQMFADYRRRYD